MAPCWLWENLWGLQRYTVKKPGEMRISKSEIADWDLKILNPHNWAPAGAVGAVGKRLMLYCLAVCSKLTSCTVLACR